MVTNITAAEELKHLGEKREALERVVRVAVAIERLHHGLKAAMLMGKPASSIPKKMMANVDRLDEMVKLMPSAKIKEILGQLETAIQERLALIMGLVEMEEGRLISQESIEGQDIETLLREYRKKAQTAITLKILLHSRGEVTKPLALPVSVDDVRERLAHLDRREQECRKTVRQEIVLLIEDTDRILKRPDLPEKMREVVAATREDFQRNLEHIDAGKAVVTLPIAVEIIEMGEGEGSIFEGTPPMPQKAGSPPPQPEQKEAVPEKPAAQEAVKSTPRERPGFFRKFFRWITTPLHVTWDDVESEIEKRHGESEKTKKR